MGAFERRFPGSSDGKASACNTGDLGLNPGLGRSPEEGNGNPLQYSCLEKSMDGGAWLQATVHGITKSQTRLSSFTGSLGSDPLPRADSGIVTFSNSQCIAQETDLGICLKWGRCLVQNRVETASLPCFGASQMVLVVKNLPANAGDTRDVSSIPKSGISPGLVSGNHSSSLAWKISWTEEPGELQSMGLHGVRHDWAPVIFRYHYHKCFRKGHLCFFHT